MIMCPMFDKMYIKRLKAYKRIGYEVCAGLENEKQGANAIFDCENDQGVYRRDLLGATKNIIISIPAVSGPKIHDLINTLKERQVLGVQVTIMTWEADSYEYGDSAFWMQLHQEMRLAGFYIKTVQENCGRFAIIDQEIVWYGNMNYWQKKRSGIV